VAEAGSEQRTRKLKKGSSPTFHQDSKTVVADHQQLKSAISAEAISSTHAYPIRSSVFLVLAFWNQVQPPSSLPGRYVASAFGRKRHLYFPEMSLRLFCGVVNPKRAENGVAKPSQQALCNHLRLFAPRIRSSNQTSSGGQILESPAASPPDDLEQ